MKTRTLALASMMILAAAWFAPAVLAAPFDAEFQIVQITGTCKVKQPGKDAEDAVLNGRYPFGSILTTDRNSACVVRLSQGNGFRVFARTTVEVTEDTADKSRKVLKLSDDGSKVQVKLETDFHKNNGLRVETPSAVCGAVGCDFTVDYQIIADLKTTLISVTEGLLKLTDPLYTLTEVDDGDNLTISVSPDGKFIRIKVERGSLKMTFKDGEHSEKEIVMTAGDEVTISQVESTETGVVIAYKFDFAEEGRADEIYKIKTSGPLITPGQLTPQDWPNITITTAMPEKPTVTPPGER